MEMNIAYILGRNSRRSAIFFTALFIFLLQMSTAHAEDQGEMWVRQFMT
jgi:hypothetical protein